MGMVWLLGWWVAGGVWMGKVLAGKVVVVVVLRGKGRSEKGEKGGWKGGQWGCGGVVAVWLVLLVVVWLVAVAVVLVLHVEVCWREREGLREVEVAGYWGVLLKLKGVVLVVLLLKGVVLVVLLLVLVLLV